MLKAVLSVIVVLVMANGAMAAERLTGKVTGKMAQKGGAPLAGGLAFFFNKASGPPPLPDKYWRVPDEIAELDAEGFYSTELLEGIYYLGAIKRISGKDVGPPNEGDLYLTIHSLPEKQRTVTVKAGTTLDVGTIAEAIPYRKSHTVAGVSGIEGIVVDPDGKPVQGVFVFAFMTPSMVGRPLFVSEKTGGDGKFLLRVANEGSYYLKVKELYGGGPPRQGGIIGGYGEETPKAVEVKVGSIVKGLKIKGSRFQGQGQVKKPQ